MKTMFTLFLWGIISFTTSGCEGKEDELQAQVDNLEFELVVLDEEGNEKSVFEENTDITLALQVNNKSGKDFLWKYSYGCQLTQLEDFLLVYKKMENNSETGDNQTKPVGRPYIFPSYCLTINFPPDTIPPGIHIVVGAQWSNNPDKVVLGPGKYFTAFNHTLNMDGHQKKLDMRVDFEIK